MVVCTTPCSQSGLASMAACSGSLARVGQPVLGLGTIEGEMGQAEPQVPLGPVRTKTKRRGERLPGGSPGPAPARPRPGPRAWRCPAGAIRCAPGRARPGPAETPEGKRGRSGRPWRGPRPPRRRSAAPRRGGTACWARSASAGPANPGGEDHGRQHRPPGCAGRSRSGCEWRGSGCRRGPRGPRTGRAAPGPEQRARGPARQRAEQSSSSSPRPTTPPSTSMSRYSFSARV